DAAEGLGLPRVAGAARSERGADRLRVDLTHQLADVLPLAYGRRAAVDVSRRTQRIAQLLGQVDRGQMGFGQAQELLTEILGRVGGALSRALARALWPPIISLVVVRSGGHGTPLSAAWRCCLQASVAAAARI